MKRNILIVLAVSLIFLFAYAESGCCFTDDTGDPIRLKEKPSRTAVLFSSFADMWLLSGGSVEVTVGESIERGFVPEGIYLVDSGAGKKIDVEALVMSGPEFIIGSKDIPSHVQAKEQLKKTGIPFALFHVESLDDYMRVFRIMTNINDNEGAFELYGENVRKQADSIIQKAERYKEEYPQEILFIRSGSSYSSAKAKTKGMHFAAQMLDDLGAKNIAEEIPVIIDGLSFEEIYMKDPDAIFVSLMGNEHAAKEYMANLLAEPEWGALKAVKNGRVYFLSKDLFQFKPNEQWALAYQQIARMLYQEWNEE